MTDYKGHTPGPWVARMGDSRVADDWCIGLPNEDVPIDYVAVCGKANARLIAAAPELAERCAALEAENAGLKARLAGGAEVEVSLSPEHCVWMLSEYEQSALLPLDGKRVIVVEAE